MRCPSCGKMYPANEKMCNLCKERLVSEAIYSNRLSVARQKAKEANVPKCPTCSSTNIEKISSFDKAAGAVMFGLFSKTARSQFKCKNCGYKW